MTKNKSFYNIDTWPYNKKFDLKSKKISPTNFLRAPFKLKGNGNKLKSHFIDLTLIKHHKRKT